MLILISLVTAVLAAVGVFLLLSRTVLRMVLGVAFLAYAANLMILGSGGVVPFAPPLLGEEGPWVDPLPQALILTAIVIGFGTTALLLALAMRTVQDTGIDDLRHMDDVLDDEGALPDAPYADSAHPTNPEEPPPAELPAEETSVVTTMNHRGEP